MIIKRVYIKNFKAYTDDSKDLAKNCIIIGDNDSGKTSILEALDIFFNKDSVDESLIPNKDDDVVIGILTDNNQYIKKIYHGKSHKIKEIIGNKSILDNITYLFIPHALEEICKYIEKLANSKIIKQFADDGTTNKVETAANDEVMNILSLLDKDLLVVGKKPKLVAKPKVKWESGIKYNVSSDDVPLESRGSGYQKNLIYALLTSGEEYKNVILGIDEIENSFSIANVKHLMKIVREKFMQTIVTTHSTSIMENMESADVLPIFTGNIASVVELYSHLGGGISKDTKLILVEGKNDVPWIKKALELINLDLTKYVVVPCGGHGNINNIKKEFEAKKFECRVIKDGDAHESCSIKKECIELYMPVQAFNRMFSLSVINLPSTKEKFFDECKKSPNYSKYDNDTIKKCIADEAANFLDVDNELINEIRDLIK